MSNNQNEEFWNSHTLPEAIRNFIQTEVSCNESSKPPKAIRPQPQPQPPLEPEVVE